MEFLIKARGHKAKTKIYRWLRRNKAFPYFIDGKNYSTVRGKTLEQIHKTIDNENDFALCEGNYFFLDLLYIGDNKELMNKIYNYLCKLIDNKDISIKRLQHTTKENLDFIFHKTESYINPDCKNCYYLKEHPANKVRMKSHKENAD